jgi:hypothetical protein
MYLFVFGASDQFLSDSKFHCIHIVHTMNTNIKNPLPRRPSNTIVRLSLVANVSIEPQYRKCLSAKHEFFTTLVLKIQVLYDINATATGK